MVNPSIHSLVGTAYPDWIDGGRGDDRISGGAGDDLLIGGLGADVLDGGDGDDRLVFTADGTWLGDRASANLGSPRSPSGGGSVPLAGRAASSDVFIGGAGVDTLVGTNGNDSVLLDAGLGTVSEIFDGAAPHTPRGAPSQAWSVACPLEAWWRLEKAKRKSKPPAKEDTEGAQSSLRARRTSAACQRRHQHRRGAHILAHFCQRMFPGAGEIHYSFDGGVDEFGSEDHRNRQHNHSPIAGGNFKPDAEGEHKGGYE